MANGVHTLMHTMEPPPPYPPFDLRNAQPQRTELSASNHTVLPSRELRDRPIRWGLRRFPVHMNGK
jgi:hypothetical protein